MDIKTIKVQVDDRVMKAEYTLEMLEEIKNLQPFDYVNEEELLRRIKLKERKRKLEKIKNNIKF